MTKIPDFYLNITLRKHTKGVAINWSQNFVSIDLSGFEKRYLQDFLTTISFEACSVLGVDDFSCVSSD